MAMKWICGLLLAAPAYGAPFYADKLDLMHYIEAGERRVVTSQKEWEVRRAHVLENMQEVMGPIPEPPQGPVAARAVEEREFPMYVQRKLMLAVEPGDELPVLLLIPKNLTGRAPAMLCLHPTSPHGKGVTIGEGERSNRGYAVELAERGYVALAPDYPGFGDYAGIDVYAMGYGSATAKGIYNHRRCVDYLQKLPEVDPERIGSIGHSLGGHNTLYLGAFDQRVKAMVTSCGFNRFAKYYGGDLTGWSHKGYMPRIAEVYGKDPARMPFDFTEVLGVLAPRHVFISAPINDANFEVSGVRDCVEAALPVYELYGAGDRLVAHYPDCEHDFPPEMREAAYAFLDGVFGHTPGR